MPHVRRFLPLLLLCAASAAACAPASDPPPPDDEAPAVDDAPLADIGCAIEHGEPAAQTSSEAPKTRGAGASLVLFLNAHGGTFREGDDDSSADLSSLIRHTTTIPAFQGSPADWSETVACVRQTFDRWNMRVTDRDPGQEPHIEAVVGGSPGLLGYSASIGGVAQLTGSFQDGAPRINERAVVFAFSEHPGLARPSELCIAIAHEVGHALSLDHETRCGDIMSYGLCRPATFTEGESSCGTTSPRECFTSTTQNARARLDGLLGRKNGGPAGNQAPFVKVLAPGNQAVESGSPVDALVRIWDDGDVDSATVSFRFGGQDVDYPLQSDDGILFRASIPTTEGDVGAGKLRARATDDDASTTRTKRTNVTVD